MSHEHHHHNASHNIGIALVLNAIFVVIEVVGGLFTNSIAILTDALHDFGDCLSLGLAFVLQKKSQKSPDSHYSYGYKRFSLLGSVFLSGVLTISSGFVIFEAIKRIINPEQVLPEGMCWIAIFGVIINGLAALKVHHGHSLNERAIFLHIMEDVLGWLAVLIVAIIMVFVELPILDPILSIAISCWILYYVFGNLRETSRIFLQAVPADINIDDLRTALEAVPGIISIHDLHVWSLDGESHVMTVHIVTSEEDTSSLTKELCLRASHYHIEHTTISFEKPGTVCTTCCD